MRELWYCGFYENFRYCLSIKVKTQQQIIHLKTLKIATNVDNSVTKWSVFLLCVIVIPNNIGGWPILFVILGSIISAIAFESSVVELIITFLIGLSLYCLFSKNKWFKIAAYILIYFLILYLVIRSEANHDLVFFFVSASPFFCCSIYDIYKTSIYNDFDKTNE
jgi:hypothetical protein